MQCVRCRPMVDNGGVFIEWIHSACSFILIKLLRNFIIYHQIACCVNYLHFHRANDCFSRQIYFFSFHNKNVGVVMHILQDHGFRNNVISMSVRIKRAVR
jgi:hypothetical protein